MAAASLSLVVTMVALLAGIGVIPMQVRAGDDQTPVASRLPRDPGGASGSAANTDTTAASGVATGAPEEDSSRTRTARSVPEALPDGAVADDASRTALPTGSGTGRRVVFSESAQRVWLVEDDGTIASTYLVSGSVTDNLGPGKYDVYSRSRHAVGIQDSGVMEYFVRFTRGQNAAIGFHSIPTKNGTPLQTVAQLGTPQSHGCIRQKQSDAERMWDFAGIGTDVVVVA
jgi:hypothetical protein